ncbi:MAG: hypothetical protein ACXWD3_00480 [Mycobacterium sp.]
MLILQAALLTFISFGVVAIVAVYVVRSRKVNYRQETDPYLGSLSQMGVVPPTPLPEWAYWTGSEQSDNPDESPSVPR